MTRRVIPRRHSSRDDQKMIRAIAKLIENQIGWQAWLADPVRAALVKRSNALNPADSPNRPIHLTTV